MTRPSVTMTEEQFRVAVGAAVLAPSMHNSQPWRFRRTPDGLQVRADPERELTVSDPTGWATRIACAAAAENARVALAVAGFQVEAALLPDPDEANLLVRLSCPGPHTPTQRDRDLYAAIPHRHSNRQPFADEAVPAALRGELVTAANEAGTQLDLVSDRAKVAEIAAVLFEADAALRRDQQYQDELAARTRHSESGTGIPVHAAGPGPAGYDLLPMREFGGEPRQDRRYFEADPLVGVLSTPGATQIDELTAGFALQRVLLTATHLGLAASMMSQAIELPTSRQRLADTRPGRVVPQMVLRFGYGRTVFATPRRPITDVIDAPES